MKKIVLLLVLISNYAISQTLNDYQYVMVPAKFADFKKDNQFGLNVTTKLLLQKYGFKAYLPTDTLPLEIINSNCNKLYADLVKDNNFINTKLKVVLKDCQGKVLYETPYGMSKEKDLQLASNLALREAAKSFDVLVYRYNGKNGMGNEASKITAEAKPTEAGGSKAADTSVPQTATNTNGDNQKNFFFAQPITNGYQVVNNEPRVIMRLLNTSQKDLFIAEMGTTNGVVINKNGQWIFEFYDSGKLKSETLNLKF